MSVACVTVQLQLFFSPPLSVLPSFNSLDGTSDSHVVCEPFGLLLLLCLLRSTLHPRSYPSFRIFGPSSRRLSSSVTSRSCNHSIDNHKSRQFRTLDSIGALPHRIRTAFQSCSKQSHSKQSQLLSSSALNISRPTPQKSHIVRSANSSV